MGGTFYSSRDHYPAGQRKRSADREQVARTCGSRSAALPPIITKNRGPQNQVRYLATPTCHGHPGHARARAGCPWHTPARPTLPHIVIGSFGRNDETISRAEQSPTRQSSYGNGAPSPCGQDAVAGAESIPMISERRHWARKTRHHKFQMRTCPQNGTR